MEDTPRRLMWHGMFLFLLGLLTGFLEPHFVNMRMGLAAHLEGVMNGIFLLALGCAWTKVRLAPTALAVAFWAMLYSAYVNWLCTTLAALWGTAALSPVTGMAHPAKPWQEMVVTVGLFSVALALIAGTILVLWGLRRAKSSA
ncbi:MAG: hydrogenase [Acidobacteriaceae bacterium]